MFFASCFNICFRKSTPLAPTAVVVVCAQPLFTSFLRAIKTDFSLTMEKGNAQRAGSVAVTVAAAAAAAVRFDFEH